MGKAVEGRGSVTIGNRQFTAHRVSWEIHRSPVRDGQRFWWACGNRLCVNPAHLSLSGRGGISRGPAVPKIVRALGMLAEAGLDEEPITLGATTRPIWWWLVTKEGKKAVSGVQPRDVPDIRRLLESLPESELSAHVLLGPLPGRGKHSKAKPEPIPPELVGVPHTVWRDGRGRIVNVWRTDRK